MKIKRFGVIPSDKKSKIYYIKFINSKNEDLFAGYNSSNLDIIISNYIELKADNPNLFYYILEETKNSRALPEEELKVLIDSKKFNI
jgi:hypothetical protein